MNDILQWFGCVTGITGSLFLALNNKHSGWGFVLFLLSNMFWMAFGISTNAPGLITTQVFFTITSSLGVYKWLIKNASKDSISNS